MSTSLAEASEARKARLIALRRRKAGEATGDELNSKVSILSNRNFDPESRTLKKRTANGTNPEDEDTVEKAVEGMAELIIKQDEAKQAEELDVFNIAPKRQNWDLKRETDKKLAKLERRTQEAIHTLIRQRLAAQKGNSDDLVGAMKAQEAAQASDDED